MHQSISKIPALLLSLLALTLLTLSFPATAQNMDSAPATSTNIWPPASPQAVDFRSNMKDVLFAFDKYEDPTNKATLQADAAYLNAHPEIKIRIDGYTDSRGTIVYNLALAQKRADIAKQDLIKAGVSSDRIMSATGWGKLYPTCDMDSDQCWDVNRRAHLRFYW
jgi:outer membrane protein OmpA-like peptidoglycan-associated protein